MRPLRLSMTAFGPYAGTEVVDFEDLAELGLFAVAGDNGSGKTTIFDGLYFALYGSLPGRRAGYQQLRSDHAASTEPCRVELDFVAAGQHWRIVRYPKQQRPKRRGTGMTTDAHKVTLYRVQGGQAIAECSGYRDVEPRCRELVGLDGQQFERVALLPQGLFSRLLTQSTTQRRSLLRTLFGSEIFAEATDRLVAQATAAGGEQAAATAQLEQRLATVVDQVVQLTGRAVDSTTAGVQAALELHCRQALDPRRDRVGEYRVTANERRAALGRARDIAARIERRDRVETALGEHELGAEAARVDRRRLVHARAAVPIMAQVQAFTDHRAEADRAQAQVASAIAELVPELTAMGFEPIAATISSWTPAASVVTVDTTAGSERTDDAATDPERADLDRAVRLGHRPSRGDRADRTVAIAAATEELEKRADELVEQIAAFERIQGLRVPVEQLRSKLASIDSATSRCQDQRGAIDERRRRVGERLDSLNDGHDPAATRAELEAAQASLAARTELGDLDEALGDTSRLRQAALIEREALAASISEALAGQARHGELLETARSSADRLDTLLAHRDAVGEYRSLLAERSQVRVDHGRSEQLYDRLFEAYVGGASARLAENLVEGEPCSVCGSTDHPEPAGASDHEVDSAQVVTARDELERLADRKARIDQQLESLLLYLERDRLAGTDTPADPAYPSRLAEAIEAARGQAIAADNAVDKNLAQVNQLDSFRARDQAISVELEHIQTHRSELDQVRNQLIGGLGPLASASTHDLAERVDAAKAAVRRCANIENEILALGVELRELADQADRLGLEAIEFERRRAGVAAELATHEAELAAAEAEVGATPSTRTGRAEVLGDRRSAPDDLAEARADLKRVRALVGGLTRLDVTLINRFTTRRALTEAEQRVSAALHASTFQDLAAARAAALTPDSIDELEASTQAWSARLEQLRGELAGFGELPERGSDLAVLAAAADDATRRYEQASTELTRAEAQVEHLGAEATTIQNQLQARSADDARVRRLERLAALVSGDNAHNTSLENWVLSAHLREVVELANLRLARSSRQRFQLCVVAEGETRRAKWGLDLAVEDTVTGTRRPTAGLSGGELFQASLALALGLADVVMNQRAGVRIDALFIDEGFGSLDEVSVERVIDLLDDLRSRGATVGVITHVPALLEALPRGITVRPRPDGIGSTIHQGRDLAA